jgi:hypothetical protein
LVEGARCCWEQAFRGYGKVPTVQPRTELQPVHTASHAHCVTAVLKAGSMEAPSPWTSRVACDVLAQIIVPAIARAAQGDGSEPGADQYDTSEADDDLLAEARTWRATLASLPAVCRDWAAAVRQSEHASLTVRNT